MGIAKLLRLVGAVRRLAFDRALPPSEALGRIRDAFATTTAPDPRHRRRPAPGEGAGRSWLYGSAAEI